MSLASSNGKGMIVWEYCEFDSGFGTVSACSATADAFSRAVQSLVGKPFKDPSFRAMVQ
jgi:hypothetical protein